ncbi:MAG: hypothetical protein M0T84_00255 [Betaproteobacteria bacterium]|nr:hypothetical protein [Betaproteobacteria bacterium]
MSKLSKRLAATVPFAHLLGIRAESDETEEERKEREEKEAKRDEWQKKAEADPERKQRDDESDEDYAKRMEAMDEEEDDDDDSDLDGVNKEDKEEGEKEKAARRSERARCARIVAHGIKNGCVNQAGVFAFDTNMSAAQAISALNAGRLDGKRGGLAERMAALGPLPNPGTGPAAQADPSSPAAFAAAAIAAADKARGR